MSSIVGDFARLQCRCADSECEHRQEIIPKLPTKKADSPKQPPQKYIFILMKNISAECALL